MNRDEELRRVELEILLQIAQTQRSTVLVLDQTMRVLDQMMAKPAISEVDREAKFQKQSKEILNQMDAAERRCLERVTKEADAILGKQRYWESAVGNLQTEVSWLIRRTGQDRDKNAIDGIFKG